MEEEFKKYLSGAALGGAVEPCLKQVVEQWPWFSTARILLAVAEKSNDSRLVLSEMAYPLPSPFLKELAPEEFLRRSTGEIIDEFLKKGEYKIVPQEGTPETGPGEEETVTDDELVTEELAEIYLAQGLYDQAGAIYRKLSLLYPEKSVYFAEIIDKIGSIKEQSNN